MGTPQPISPSPDRPWGGPQRPARPDVVVIGEAEEAPVQRTLDDLQAEMAAEDELAARIAPVLQALDRGVERTRKESEAEARRIVAAARDEAARVRKGIEDELVAAHLGLDRLRARRDEAVQQLRTLYDIVVSMSEDLDAGDAARGPDPSTEDPAAEIPFPPPPGAA